MIFPFQDPSAKIGNNCRIGPNVTIGPNVIIEDGVSSNNRKDGQAKSLGEYLRAKFVEIPIEIIEGE